MYRLWEDVDFVHIFYLEIRKFVDEFDIWCKRTIVRDNIRVLVEWGYHLLNEVWPENRYLILPREFMNVLFTVIFFSFYSLSVISRNHKKQTEAYYNNSDSPIQHWII